MIVPGPDLGLRRPWIYVYTKQKQKNLCYFNIPTHDLDRSLMYTEDMNQIRQLMSYTTYHYLLVIFKNSL